MFVQATLPFDQDKGVAMDDFELDELWDDADELFFDDDGDTKDDSPPEWLSDLALLPDTLDPCAIF